MVEKYYSEDGNQVAVLYSPGYGAGWSTWHSDGEFAMFDKTLVEMALRDAPIGEVDDYLESLDNDGYTGGWEDIQVRWVSKGSKVHITDYDGNESFHDFNDNYPVA